MAEPKISTVKQLFAMSGNMCAFPGCALPIFETSGTLIGEMCHIKAENPGGPRYDPDQKSEERRSIENLLLLCRNHHKIVDSEPVLFDANALKEMKAIHEDLVGRPANSKDAFFARILLNAYKHISINGNNVINVMFSSPGAVQGNTVNVNVAKRNLSVNAPPGSVGFNVQVSGYIQHLIKRYNEFASLDIYRKNRFSYGAISKNIADKFGTQWKLLPIERATDVIGYLQDRISRTRQAKVNRSKGWKSFSTFEEYVEKYGK